MRIGLVTLAIIMLLKALVAFYVFLDTGNNMWAQFVVTDSALGIVALYLTGYVKGNK